MAIFILQANPHQVYSWRKHLGRTAEPCAQTWSIFTHVHFSYWDFSEPPSESSHISRDRAILIQFALTLSDIVSWSRHMSLDLVTQGCVCVCVCVLSHVQLLLTPRTVAWRASVHRVAKSRTLLSVWNELNCQSSPLCLSIGQCGAKAPD